MRRARLGVTTGLVGVGGLLAIGLADCAEPTQIEIDVRTDGCPVVKNTGIAVTTPARVDEADLTIFTPRAEGCEARPRDRIGTLVLHPSGAKDAEVAVRIVTGVDRTAQDCGKGPYDGCIVARRILRFVPGTSQKVIVIMSRACVGKDCALGGECQSGQCVSTASDGGLADGAPEPEPADAGDPEAKADAAADADAGVDPCASCTGAGTTCNGGMCTIDCAAGADCTGATVCGPGLDCTVRCSAAGVCEDLTCAASAGSCLIECSGDDACGNIACSAPSCHVNCSQGNRCTGRISLTGGDAGLVCSGNNSCGSASVYCDAGSCRLDCSASCPDPRVCSSGAGCVGSW